jgi:hypothetical protein
MGIVGSGYLNARHPIVTAKSAIFEVTITIRTGLFLQQTQHD